jgi:hypothetical protein
MVASILIAVGSLAGLTGLLLVFSKRNKIVIVLFLVYAGTYLPFSIAGRYVVSNHGGNHWTRDWCPRHLVCEYRIVRPKTKYTAPGIVYLPCILLDRWLWHPGGECEG